MCPDPVCAMWPHRFPGAFGPGRPLAVGAACCCLWHRWCSGLRARPPGARRRRVRGGLPGPCVCYVAPQVSGRLRARPPARSPHASLRLGVVDLEARPCPPDPPAPSTPVGSRRPPIGRYLVCMYLARPCRRPQAPRPGLLTTLSQQTVRNTQTPPCRVRPGYLPRRGRPWLSPGARRAPGAWRAPRRAASRRSGTPTPPTRRPSRSSGTSARPRGR